MHFCCGLELLLCSVLEDICYWCCDAIQLTVATFGFFRAVRDGTKHVYEEICKNSPITTRRMLLTSLFMYLFYYPTRYLPGPHNSALYCSLIFAWGFKLYIMIATSSYQFLLGSLAYWNHNAINQIGCSLLEIYSHNNLQFSCNWNLSMLFHKQI